MITVASLEETEGKWINEFVRLLTVPKEENGRYTALAQVGTSLAIIEVSVTPQRSI